MKLRDSFFSLGNKLFAAEVVSSVYRGLLGREPDAEALAAYSQKLADDRDLGHLIVVIGDSREHWERLLAKNAESLVRSVFQGLLRREPEQAALANYARELAESKNLGQLVGRFGQSEEHWNLLLQGKAEVLVRSIFLGLLQWDPDQVALETYTRQLAGSKDLGQLLAQIGRSEELWTQQLQIRAETLVRNAFQGLLQREPDAKALALYGQKLAEDKDVSDLLAEIGNSQEHWERLFGKNAEGMVRSVFQGLLQREPDAAALEAHSRQLAESKDLGPLLAHIGQSEELWKQLLQNNAGVLVHSIFQGLLQREPDAVALETYSQKLAEDKDLSRVLAAVGGSQEHWERLFGKNAETLVRSVFQGLLQREPDAAALEAHTRQLAESKDLGQLLAHIGRSEELWSQLIRARAESLMRSVFQGLLQREPDAEALAAYSQKLAEDKDMSGMLAVVGGSQEHWERLFEKKAETLVRSIFKGLLLREPDAETLSAYSQRLAEDKDLAGLLAVVGESQEHWERLFGKKAETLVRSVFQGLLRREPDPATLEVHTRQLVESGDLGQLLAHIGQSEELWKQLIQSNAGALVRSAFQGLLQREPNDKALAAYCGKLEKDKDLAGLFVAIGDSQEHWERLLEKKAATLVRSLFQGLLGLGPDQAESENYTRQLAQYTRQLAQSKDLGQLITRIAQSQEHWNWLIASRAETLVSTAYQALLGRDPDEAEMKPAAHELAQTRDLTQLITRIAASREHYSRIAALECQNPLNLLDKRCVIFLHVQKTAGTSMQNMLRGAFPGEPIFQEHDDTLYRYPGGKLAEYSVFSGHFNFDSLAFIPRQNKAIFTFLREPKSRLLSMYYFIRAHEPRHKSFHFMMQLANELDAPSFFEHSLVKEDHSTWNHMTWAVMGHCTWKAWCSRLAQAVSPQEQSDFIEEVVRPSVCRRLKEFVYIGLQEDYKNSVDTLFKILRVPAVPEIREDHSLELLMRSEPNFKRSVERQPMTERLDAALNELVHLDKVLYEEAVRLRSQAFHDASPQSGALVM